ncbi:MAG: adenylyl-sulfate kinase [Pyrobaculum sp.]
MRCLNRGVVAWLTGLPAAGKTTVANLAAEMLRQAGLKVEVLDGDWVRGTIHTGVGFTKEERRLHLLKVAWIARLLARNGVVVIAAFVSPYRDVRAEVRKIVEEEVPFVEIYVKVPLEVAIRRDPKGLYAKALRGEIKNFTGIDDPYEEPTTPDLVLENDGVSPEENAKQVATHILHMLTHDMNYIS